MAGWDRTTSKNEGVFLVKMKNAFVLDERVFSVNTFLWISTVPWGSEQSKWASLWLERAHERSKPVNGGSKGSERSEVERWRVSEWSEQCERMNIVSDRVACSRRDCLWLETRPEIWPFSMCESICHRPLWGRWPKGDRLINRPTNQPTDQPTDRPTNRPTDQPT